MTEGEKINPHDQWNTEDNHVCGLLLMKKKCIFQGGQQMAQHLWSLREAERVREEGLERERDLFVSFVFLVD